MGHWADVAQQWEQVGPPLRPSSQDLALCTDAIHRWARDHGAPRALMLGVTPELYHLPWPSGTDVLAVDHTRSMIDALWPGPRSGVICADWTAMPLRPGSRDIALCDGGLHLLAYPHEQRTLVRTLHEVLAPGGLCILRLFVPPGQRESPDAVLQDLVNGRIPNVNLLKMRLFMALQDDVTEGVRLTDIWGVIRRVAPDLDCLASRIGWPPEHIRVINTYRASPQRYSFLSVAGVRDLFCRSPGGFDVATICVPTYALGDRCPTVVLHRCP